MGRPRREDILEQYRACAAKLGKTPGLAAFSNMAKLKPADVTYYWPNHGSLVLEAGFQPNKAKELIPEAVLFSEYARVCQHLQKIPTVGELHIATRELNTRTFTVRGRFGTIGEFDDRFRQWLESQPDTSLREILEFDGWDRPSQFGRKQVEQREKVEYYFHPFLPACLQYLDVIARGERPPHLDLAEALSVVFERGCSDAFRCWGFEVESLGQGKGRKADCLALARQEGFAVIIDAKVRSGGYVLGQEDRKFLEYAKTHTCELESQGIKKVYLIVVGPSFQQADSTKLAEYLADSTIRGATLMTAKGLMRLVEESIRNRNKFRLGDVDKLLFGNRIIAE